MAIGLRVGASSAISAWLLLSGCERLPASSSTNEPSPVGAAVRAETSSKGGGNWKLSQTSDAMTDETGLIATASFRSGQLVTDVAVQCLSQKRLSYVLEFRDSDGKGIAVNEHLPSGFLQARLDDNEPIDVELAPLRYSNVVALEDQDIEATLITAGALGGAEIEGPYVTGLATRAFSKYAVAKVSLANQVRFKTALLGGDSIVTLDQTNARVKRVLDDCGVGHDKVLQGVEREQQAQTKAKEAYRLKLLHGDQTVPVESHTQEPQQTLAEGQYEGH